MTYTSREKIFSAKWFKAYALILIGAFIVASGFVFFVNPHRIVPGGVYGIGIVVNYLTEGLLSWAPDGFPIGLTGLILNIPLTILGIKLLGPRFGVKTVVGFILTSVFIDGLHFFLGYDLMVDDALLSTIFGGVLIGFGLGLIFRSKATSGGTDIIAMILAKYTRLPVGQLIMYVDSAIVLLALVAFGDWKIPLYSWVVIFITGKVIDVTLEGIGYDKALIIISKQYELIRTKLIGDINRTGTLFKATGMYENKERQVIFTTVNRLEAHMLKDYISEIDPHAFIVIVDATEILGEGFKPLKPEE
jgi:uncharacterized membrane-anchored protein YitT (DUF2179 family)